MAFSSQFYEPESRFVDVIEINLTKADLVNQVQKLDAKINPVINPDEMDLEEYKTYIHNQVSQSAQADIFNGQDIVMSDGSTGHFTFTLEDQSNTASAMASVRELLGQGVPIEQLSVPYHSSGNPCEMFSVVDFTNIYTTLYLHSTYVQTYCNAINMLTAIKDFQTKYNLAVDGQAGKNTITKLDSVIAAKDNKNFKAFVGACTTDETSVYQKATGATALATYPMLNRGNLVDVIEVSGSRYKIKIANAYTGYIDKNKITTPRLKMQEEKIQKYNDDLFEKQKKYHAESIEIRNGLKQDQDNLSDQISELNQMMSKLNNNFVKKEISDMRTTLLDFANAIMNDRDYNREQYEHILDVYQDYENVLEENHMDNGRVTRSMEYVKKNYDYLIEHGFKK